MQLMQDGADEDEDRDEEEEQQQQPSFAADGGNQGQLVRKAQEMMQEEEQVNVQADEDTGPKIKMGKIGGKKKKKGKGGKDSQSPRGGAADAAVSRPSKQSSGFSGGQGFTEQDVEFMKKAIQMLCQSTNPLGKSIDFVTDDVDSMSKEYEKWRKESISCASGLED